MDLLTEWSMNVNTDSAHHELCNIFLDLDTAADGIRSAVSSLDYLLYGGHYTYERDYYWADCAQDLIDKARNAWRLALMIDDVLNTLCYDSIRHGVERGRDY